jgi:NurA-like 5'-3' nuclease
MYGSLMGHRRIEQLLGTEVYGQHQGFGENYRSKTMGGASEEEQWMKRNGMGEGI